MKLARTLSTQEAASDGRLGSLKGSHAFRQHGRSASKADTVAYPLSMQCSIIFFLLYIELPAADFLVKISPA